MPVLPVGRAAARGKRRARDREDPRRPASRAAQFAEGYFEVTVSATVTARAGERTLFLAEAVQAGIFHVRNVPQEEMQPLLAVACPTIVFPYLRETISDLISRGGFPPVLLTPISFESLYMQRLQQERSG